MSEKKWATSNASRQTACVADAVEKRSHSRRDERGFTMVELMTVISIIIVLLGVGFIALTTIMRNLQQEELDGNARQIFIVAQNHLSAASSQGILGRITNGEHTDFKCGVQKVERDGEESDEIYYFFVDGSQAGSSDSNLDKSTSVLGQMLPAGSIDETLRKGGTYVIRYNLKTATVLDVFYANLTPTSFLSSSTKGIAFTKDNADKLFDDYKGEDKKADRQDYPLGEAGNVIVGWCGGIDSSLESFEIERPTLTVSNDERLIARVKNNLADEGVLTTLRLVITGEESGNSKTITLMQNGIANAYETNNATNVARAITSIGNGAEYVVCLDDITEENKKLHFVELFGSSDSLYSTGALIPGENIKLQAFVSSSNTLTPVKSSWSLVRNSLFASVNRQQGASADEAPIARISNIRHLANLSNEVSGYDPDNFFESIPNTPVSDTDDDDSLTGASSDKTWAKKAIQIGDISWTDFRTKIITGESRDRLPRTNLSGQESISGNGSAVGLTGEQLNEQIAAVTVIPYETVQEGLVTSAVEKEVVSGSFLPVKTDTFALDYDGGSHRISDVIVDRGTNEGNAGLFESIESGVTVKNVNLENFKLNASSGKAGALAGEVVAEATVENVLACNDNHSAGSENDPLNLDDSEYEINSASGDAGGLVGTLGANLKNCAAAVYVNAGANAGGLVGSTNGTVAIEKSYAGGHTRNGEYGTNATYTTESGDAQGRMNVIGGTNAGGLVGSNTGTLALNNCYSTASAYANIATGSAGGLVGSSSGTGASATFNNCYTTSLVSSAQTNEGATTPNLGAFIGSGVGTWVSTDGPNRYFEIVNQDQTLRESEFGENNTNVVMADQNVTTYSDFVNGSKIGYAHDAMVTIYYGGKFPFKTIQELTGTEDNDVPADWPEHLKVHYGDWPSLETFVVNTPTSNQTPVEGD